MLPEERQQKLVLYAQAYDQLTTAMQEFPTEMWQFRAAPNEWTIHEIIVHIVDSEVNSYMRCRRFIAEPDKPLMAYDENQWAVALDYHNQNTESMVALFKWLRLSTYQLIQTLPAETWANTAYHPENGTMSMDDWLETYARHVPDHIEQMRRVHQAWLAQGAP